MSDLITFSYSTNNNSRVVEILDNLSKHDLNRHKIKILIIHQSNMSLNISNNYTFDFQYLNFNESGLSKARNRCIENCKTKYLTFFDDDIDVDLDKFDEILRALQSADILRTEIRTLEGDCYKHYSNGSFSLLDLFNISSVELIVNNFFVKKHGIKFDENFGLGAMYPSCEEMIFLNTCREAGAIIKKVHIPLPIHPPISSGMNFSDSTICKAKGAAFKEIFGFWFGLFITFGFTVKNILKKGGLTFRQRMRFFYSVWKGFYGYK